MALIIAVTVVVAARGTWSPCGLSMLSTVTPLAERSRGHSFARTAGWFILGAILGGTALGAATATFAWALHHVGVQTSARLFVVALAALYSAAADARISFFRVPGIPRQVDERWVDRYRPWVYGLGYGAQVGTGVATYVMTAGVYLVIVCAALSASPAAALFLGALFGLTRGLCILVGAGITNPDRLRSVHDLLDRAAPASLATCVLAELAVWVTAAGFAFGALGAGAALVIALPVVVVAWSRVHARRSAEVVV